MEPALVPGTTAQCERCRTTLRRSRQHPLEHSLALALASLILLTVMCLSTLMTVRTSGIVHHAGIFSGPMVLVQRRMSALAIVVVFVTVVAPLCKLIGTIYVLLRIRETRLRPTSAVYLPWSSGSLPGRWSKFLCRRLRRLRKAW